jgi:uncharacterized protein (TIGR02001 family)
MRGLWLISLTWMVTPARAEVMMTLTGTSDYIYRGVSQTENQPAVQAGVECSGDHAAFELWTSNANFGGPSRFFGSGHTEIATSASLFTGDERALRYELGIDYFSYPGLRPKVNYPEMTAALTHGPFSAAFHYTWTYDDSEQSAYYIEINLNRPLQFFKLSTNVHLGFSWGHAWTAYNGGPYEDFSFGVAKPLWRAILNLQIVGTVGYVPIPYGQPLSGKAEVLLSASWMFPSRE